VADASRSMFRVNATFAEWVYASSTALLWKVSPASLQGSTLWMDGCVRDAARVLTPKTMEMVGISEMILAISPHAVLAAR